MTLFSKRHYIALSTAIRPLLDGSTDRASLSTYIDRARVAHAIANALETDNPSFDRNKFLKACGLEGI